MAVFLSPHQAQSDATRPADHAGSDADSAPVNLEKGLKNQKYREFLFYITYLYLIGYENYGAVYSGGHNMIGTAVGLGGLRTCVAMR
ncbi:MAG: hypothetical protein HJJLKODD_00475 [Phycisphaerae bacterium]|nr:hypothetical protein [Phycisphaerae bacterium]